MTEAEKVMLVKNLSGETDDDTVSAFLAMAGNKVCEKAYPFTPERREVPDYYAMTQVEIAVYLLSRRGMEGLLSHSENGYSDTFESGDVPASMLRGIVPMCATLG